MCFLMYIYMLTPPWSTHHMSPLQQKRMAKIHVSFTTGQYMNLSCWHQISMLYEMGSYTCTPCIKRCIQDK